MLSSESFLSSLTDQEIETLSLVSLRRMAKLIFDIEAAGEDFDQFDETTQKMLTRRLRAEFDENSEAYKKATC